MPWRIPETDIERVKRQPIYGAGPEPGHRVEKARQQGLDRALPVPPGQGQAQLHRHAGKGLFHCMACGKAGNPIQFVEQHDGVSFRHAFEVLAHGHRAFAAQPLTKQSTVPRLPCPLDPEADDAALFGQVVAYYHERLKSLRTATMARAYLASRGLDNDDSLTVFKSVSPTGRWACGCPTRTARKANGCARA